MIHMTRGAYLGDLEEIVLLAVARLPAEAYGMRIRREIVEQAGRQIAIGAVYATLERLHDKSYVRPILAPVEEGRDGQARRFFAITRPGMKALEDSAAIRQRLWKGVNQRRVSDQA